MDMQPLFSSPISCVRCGAYFPVVHPQAPCPQCGLPTRFSLPWSDPVELGGFAPAPEPQPSSTRDDRPDASSVSSASSGSASSASSASSSRIPVLPAVESVESEAQFSGDELQALLLLRERYQQGDTQVRDDEFTGEERARLEFMRWLYRSGRVIS